MKLQKNKRLIRDRNSTQTERENEARYIQQNYGSEANYLAKAPLEDILTKDELEERDDATELISSLESARNFLEETDANVSGFFTGIQGVIPAFRTDAQEQFRNLIGKLTAEQIRKYAGTAFTKNERVNIENFLPSASKSEEQNLRAINNLLQYLELGIETKEGAARSNLDELDYYKAHRNSLLGPYDLLIEQINE